jgi:hypothetical protein
MNDYILMVVVLVTGLVLYGLVHLMGSKNPHDKAKK